ncbi:MAG: multisensor hybrid histidine kinase [Gammaproteobacteria bacterium]|jgi:signal transduction histidine kinase/FixJ family two-component response regulator|nr:multisensor hybrid histidine kinase [Gammaproteobacteria bacterium]
MLSNSGSPEMILFSNRQNLSIIKEETSIEERGIDVGTEAKATPPQAKARRTSSLSLLTLTPPLTPNARAGNGAITFKIQTLVVATTTVSAEFEGDSSLHANLSEGSEEKKDEDLPNFQVLFESTPDPQLILKPDAGFTIVAVNDAYLKSTMTRREWILKKGLFEVLATHPFGSKADEVRHLRKSLRHIMERGVADTLPIQKYHIRHPEAQSGEFEERYLRSINTPVFGKTGAVDFILHRIEDVTSLIYGKQQEAQPQTSLETLQARLEQMDTMCHELRNLLYGMDGNVTFLKSSMSTMKKMICKASPEVLPGTFQEKVLNQLKENEELLQTIRACVDCQKVIANDVLDLSKLEAGKVELNLVDFDLMKLVKDVVHLLEAQTKQKKIYLHVELPFSHMRVKGDPNRLTQVLLNLLSNALKFTLEEGNVTVSLCVLEKTPAYTEFQFIVKDTGIGMSEAEQNKLFNYFAQANPKISAAHGGSGLGLVISKKLIELMEGKIEVKSEKGKGTQFSFTIKFAPALVLEEEEEFISGHSASERKLNSPIPRPLHILIAEDNSINQKILVKQLQQAGHICYMANNGQEALEIYDQISLDLILMDIEMPVKNGLQATQIIRQRERASSSSPLPIIGLSGNARLEHQQEALDSGMDAYLTKPYEREKLLEMIAYYVPSVSSRTGTAETEDFTPKTRPLLSASSPIRSSLRPRALNSSFLTVLLPPAKKKQERKLESVKVRNKKESKGMASFCFWNNRKLVLASTLVGAIGVALAARSERGR